MTMSTVFGMELDSVGRNYQSVLDSVPCRVVDLFNNETPSLCTP